MDYEANINFRREYSDTFTNRLEKHKIELDEIGVMDSYLLLANVLAKAEVDLTKFNATNAVDLCDEIVLPVIAYCKDFMDSSSDISEIFKSLLRANQPKLLEVAIGKLDYVNDVTDKSFFEDPDNKNLILFIEFIKKNNYKVSKKYNVNEHYLKLIEYLKYKKYFIDESYIDFNKRQIDQVDISRDGKNDGIDDVHSVLYMFSFEDYFGDTAKRSIRELNIDTRITTFLEEKKVAQTIYDLICIRREDLESLHFSYNSETGKTTKKKDCEYVDEIERSLLNKYNLKLRSNVDKLG